MNWCRLPERIKSKIEMVTESGCWVWMGCTHKSGYGKVAFNGGIVYAHRATYTILVGEIPDGLTIDHLCRVRGCVNPAHLEPVTMQENIARGWHSTKTVCKKGHKLEGSNLMFNSRGNRVCRECKNRNNSAHYKRKPKVYNPLEYIKYRDRIRKYQSTYHATKRRKYRESLLPTASEV